MIVTFSHPLYLWLLILIPLFIVTHFYSTSFVKRRALRFANFEAIARVSGKKKVSANWLVLLLRVTVVLFLVFAAAGLIFWYSGTGSNTSYVLAIDASGSMLADDFEPNRLEAAKTAALLFVDTVKIGAEVGVVSFSGVSEIETKPSSSFFEVKQAISAVSFKSIHGTAIGDAITTSINLLSDDERPRVVVLLTDGRENVISENELQDVIQLAKNNQVTVQTIGMGTDAGGLVPGLEITSTIDDELLEEIAGSTGGKYYKVLDPGSLLNAFSEIATESDSQVPIPLRTPLILLALLFIFLEWGLLNTRYKTIP